MACEHGPLCEEPVRGVAYLLRAVEAPNAAAAAAAAEAAEAAAAKASDEAATTVVAAAAAAAADASAPALSGAPAAPAAMAAPVVVLSQAALRSGALGGQVIAAMTLCCRRALAASSPRLVEPMYACNLQCEQSLLGPFYEVLRRRRARIVDEDLIEGTSTFSINARLPVIESFGLADELRDMTSGASTSDTQLVLQGWHMLTQDPHFRPATEDEREEYGAWFSSSGSAGGAIANHAKTLVDRIRRRKGLATDAKIVVSAEKQRNISKKK